MYQALLTRRYLLSKIMPWLASGAVCLCTALVLITWSVMGGFLTMLVNTGRTMTGDVSISWPQTGFAHYEDLIDRLQKDPLVEAAAPSIETFAIIHLPDGRNEPVNLRGVDGPSYAKVTKYDDILWWHPLDKPLPKDKLRQDPRLLNLGGTSWAQLLEDGKTLSRKDPNTGELKPALVMGIEVSGFNYREDTGIYVPKVLNRRLPNGKFEMIDTFLPRDAKITVNVLPLDASGRGVETAAGIFPVANEFESGLFEADSKAVLIRLDALQHMLRMDYVPAAALTKQDSAFPTGDSGPQQEIPARVTHVLVKGKGEMSKQEDAELLKAHVEDVYAKFAAAWNQKVPDEFSIRIMTWREQNETFISAVEHEIALVLFLFILISFVCVILVLAIFWAMTSEKTKDIGILRALGASRIGIAWLWVRYGLAIGIFGSVLGGIAGYLIVHYINPIHEWMGYALHLQIWNPKVYYFIVIPNKVNPWQAAEVMVGFALSCAVGALIPAWRAAMFDPVKSLRFE